MVVEVRGSRLRTRSGRPWARERSSRRRDGAQVVGNGRRGDGGIAGGGGGRQLGSAVADERERQPLEQQRQIRGSGTSHHARYVRPATMESEYDRDEQEFASTSRVFSGGQVVANRGALVAQVHHRNALLRQGFWKLQQARAKGEVARRNAHLRALRHWSRALERRCFLRWAGATEAGQRSSILSQGELVAEQAYNLKRASAAFNSLVRNARHARVRSLKARRLGAVARSRRDLLTMRRALEALKVTAQSSATLARRHVLGRCIKTWAAAAYVDGSEESAEHAGRRRKRWARAVRISNERVLLQALTGWRTLPRERTGAIKAAKNELAVAFAREWALRRAMRHFAARRAQGRRKRFVTLLAIRFRWTVLVTGAFSQWRYQVGGALEKVRTARMHRRQRALHAWKRKSEQRQWERGATARALGHWARKHEARAFLGLAKGCAVMAAKRNKLQVAQQHWSRTSLQRALRQLRKRARSRSAARAALCSAQTLWARNSLALGLSQWRAQTLIGSRRRLVARLAKLCVLKRAFCAWTRLPVERENQIRLADDFFAVKVVARRKRTLVRILADHCHEQQRTRLELNFARAHQRRRAARRGLDVLGAWVDHRRFARLQAARARDHAARATLRSALRQWQWWLQLWCRTKAQLLLAQSHRHRCLISQAIGGWKKWMARRTEKQRQANHAVSWRRKRLLRAGVAAWVEASARVDTVREEQVQLREARAAARLAKRVAAIAYHWRGLALRRRLANKTTAKRSAYAPLGNVTNILPVRPAFPSYEARYQVRTGYAMDWMDTLPMPSPASFSASVPLAFPSSSSGAAGKARRPSPRKPVDVMLGLDASRSIAFSSTRSSLASVADVSHVQASRNSKPQQRCPSLDTASFSRRAVQVEERKHAASLEEEKLADAQKRIAALHSLKHQVTLDKREMASIRGQLQRIKDLGLDPDPAQFGEYFEKLTEMKMRKAEYKNERKRALQFARSCIG